MEYYRSGVQPFHHPVAGDLILDYDALEIPADPGLIIIAYTAVILFARSDRGYSRVLTAVEGRNHDRCS